MPIMDIFVVVFVGWLLVVGCWFLFLLVAAVTVISILDDHEDQDIFLGSELMAMMKKTDDEGR